MWECRGCENSRHAHQAKTTLNVLYKLTTEMGECGGWENSMGMPLNVPYWLTTEMGECEVGRIVPACPPPTPWQRGH